MRVAVALGVLVVSGHTQDTMGDVAVEAAVGICKLWEHGVGRVGWQI
jgi:hypothetical protein